MSKHIRVAYKGLKKRRDYICGVAAHLNNGNRPHTITEARKVLRTFSTSERAMAREAYFYGEAGYTRSV